MEAREMPKDLFNKMLEHCWYNTFPTDGNGISRKVTVYRDNEAEQCAKIAMDYADQQTKELRKEKSQAVISEAFMKGERDKAVELLKLNNRIIHRLRNKVPYGELRIQNVLELTQDFLSQLKPK